MRRTASSHLALMLLLTTIVFGVGAAQKAPCANRSWAEGRAGVATQCYSDIIDLRRTEQLAGGRLPYLNPCESGPDTCDEYPALTMYVMRATAWVSGDAGDPYARFFWVNAVLLLVCALAITYFLERLGATTLLFAAAPVLAVYGTMNWDLIPVAFATAATFFFLRRRHGPSGVLLGLGAAAKVYPALLIVPFAADRWRDGDRDGARTLVLWAVASWAVVNAPFAIAAPDGWSTFFRFNAERPAEYDSLWRVACSIGACAPNGLVNATSLFLTVVGTGLIWAASARRDPGFPRWTMGFPAVVLFVLTNKVWSPQYGLWLLPWFALVAPSMIPYLMYQATEVLVFAGRFSFFARLQTGSGVTYRALAVMIVVRAAALGWCLVEWMRSPTDFTSRPDVRSPGATSEPILE